MRTGVMVLCSFLLGSALVVAQRPGGLQAGETPDPRSRSLRECRDNPYNCVDTPNPLSVPDTVWLEELTWMDVRDVMAAGRTTIIVPTGGVEPNGPWLALGKHNYVLQANCDAIARKLGNALCAPIIKLVPEGSIDPPSGAMVTAGTLSLRQETFQAVLTDVAHSLKMHGFEHIIFIGDSGGNQRGQQAVAEALTAKWNGRPLVAHIPEYYDNPGLQRFLVELGVTEEGQKSDNVHDEPLYTFQMMVVDPGAVRWEQRVKLGKATIDGVSIADKARAIEIGKKLVDFHATTTVAAIRAAIANKGRTTTPR